MALYQVEHLLAVVTYRTPQNPVDLSQHLLAFVSFKPGHDVEAG